MGLNLSFLDGQSGVLPLSYLGPISRAQNWAKKLGANWLLDIFSRSQHRNLGAIWFINCTYLVAGMQRVLVETEIYMLSMDLAINKNVSTNIT